MGILPKRKVRQGALKATAATIESEIIGISLI